MMHRILDIILNIIVPILCLAASFYYVVKSGKYVKGALMGWGILVVYEILSFAIGIPISGYAKTYYDIFEHGPGVVAMFFAGWFPGIVVSLIAMLCRKVAVWVK